MIPQRRYHCNDSRSVVPLQWFSTRFLKYMFKRAAVWDFALGSFAIVSVTAAVVLISFVAYSCSPRVVEVEAAEFQAAQKRLKRR